MIFFIANLTHDKYHIIKVWISNAAASIKSKPMMNDRPLRGVIGPSTDFQPSMPNNSRIDKRYNEPEKQYAKQKTDSWIGQIGWLYFRDTSTRRIKAKVLIELVSDPVFKNWSASGESRAFNACAPKAPRITARAPSNAPEMKNILHESL